MISDTMKTVKMRQARWDADDLDEENHRLREENGRARKLLQRWLNYYNSTPPIGVIVRDTQTLLDNLTPAVSRPGDLDNYED